GLLRNAEDLTAVQVDWDVEAAVIVTRHLPEDLEARLSTRTVTTGCGQGTVFGKLLEQTSLTALPKTPLAQSTLYELLTNLNTY
ncbi:formate dehydrogenase accessory sulfurtransferase FdhD, partial [Pseudoalteromonas sp. SIMBA_153]